MAGQQRNKKKSNRNIKSWKSISVSGLILEAIRDLGFTHPTEIQALTIPTAIDNKRDIIGAAETGSGKTLAFAIPIIDGIIKYKIKEKREKKQKSNMCEETDDLSVLEDVTDSEDIEDLSNHEEIEDLLETKYLSDHEEVENQMEIEDLGEGFTGLNNDSCKPLWALIVTPTRELAIQIKNHIDSLLTKTDIKSEVVIGGLSCNKQERLLIKGPEIVIGTPGRLFQLVQEGNTHLSQLDTIRYLAIDETDRMLEKGHFEELRALLDIINKNKEAKYKRQTFVFSATLSLVHDAPRRLNHKNKKRTKLTSEQKISKLIKIVGMRDNPKIVDITPKQGTAMKLTESEISCAKDEKELYLYYFIKTYPGRTLIFCNSINCVRRLHKVFDLLQCNPKTLHASKNQKQRLNSLEKFTSKENAILFATDVAARGLDIPQVQYIVHFEVPKTAESYVHRSGRTARATEEGLSLLLVEPSEVTKRDNIFKTLNKTTEFASFPVNNSRIHGMREKVSLAKKIETAEHTIQNSQSNQSWEQKMAEAAGLLWQPEEDDEVRASNQVAKKRRSKDIQATKIHLKSLLVPHLADKFMNYSFRCGVIIPHNKEIHSQKNAITEVPRKKLKTK